MPYADARRSHLFAPWTANGVAITNLVIREAKRLVTMRGRLPAKYARPYSKRQKKDLLRTAGPYVGPLASFLARSLDVGLAADSGEIEYYPSTATWGHIRTSSSLLPYRAPETSEASRPEGAPSTALMPGTRPARCAMEKAVTVPNRDTTANLA
jgi:hypothetical protein